MSALFLVLQPGCGRRPAQIVDPTAQADVAEQLSAFERHWLGPARVAPPTVADGARKAYDQGVIGSASTLRPEAATWNQWKTSSYRLFNNRVALMFDLKLHGSGSLRWLPSDSVLVVNGQETFPAAVAPDDLLLPLLKAALQQEANVIDGDLTERTRAAGPFRSAYLPTTPAVDTLEGVIAFPLDDPDMHVVYMQLQVGVNTDEGPATLRFDFE